VVPLPGNPEPQQDFGYLHNGNIASNSKLAGTFAYQDPLHTHAVTRAGNLTYVYDPNGGMLSATDRSPGCLEVERLVQYDALEQVAWVSRGEATWRYAYDGSRARIEKRGPTGTTRYFGRLFESEDEGEPGGPLVATKFYYAGDLLVAKDRDGTKSYYHPDPLGSTQIMTDAAGTAAAASYEYAAFGETLSKTEAPVSATTGGSRGTRATTRRASSTWAPATTIPCWAASSAPTRWIRAGSRSRGGTGTATS
jgi:YD repeat-containing protein